MRLAFFPILLLFGAGASAQNAPTVTFEVATIRAVDAQPRSGRFMTMQGPHRFVAKNFTLRLLLAAAYNVNPKAITGGPAWVDSTKFEITAVTPGETQPTRDRQMAMLGTLLSERFQLTLHREQKVFSIYVLTVTKSGAKLKQSSGTATDPSSVVSTVYPDHILLPARNVSMQDFVALLQRAVLDRPVVDRTGLAGRYDFDLNWAQSEREFGGDLPAAPSDAANPPFLTALQEELGLKLEAMRGPVEALVIDRVAQPIEN